jgi:DNA-binding transcriptional LysR family regulator
MEFRHLRYFLVLAEELHFGRAAQRLAISQPPLSLNIQQLEASVGARLFTRNSRGVQLTAAGQAFVPAARGLLEGAQAAARQARDVDQGLAGTLRIGFAGTMLYRGLPQILAAFHAGERRLRVVLREMSSSDQLVELTRGRLDFGFVHTTRVPPEVSQIRVSRQPFVACLCATHPLSSRGRLGLDELAGEPLALVSRQVSPDYHEQILAACAAAGFVPDTVHELQHWLSVVSLVAQGLGVALVPQALHQSAIAGAVFVPIQGEAPSYDTHCLWKADAGRPAMEAFAQAVRWVAGQQA